MGAPVDQDHIRVDRGPKQSTITQDHVCYTIGSSKACHYLYLDMLIIFK